MYRLPRFPLLLLMLALLLAACGSPAVPDTGPARIHEFSATGLDKGDGEWLISWRTDGTTVTLNGSPVENSGTYEHDFLGPRSGVPTTYTIVVQSGDNEPVQRSLTVAPISGMTLTDSNGLSRPFELAPGGSRQLRAVVHAEEAVNAEPSQEVTWSSSNGDVVTVDANGLVRAIGLSTPGEPVEVRATSNQNNGTYRYLLFEVVDRPDIIEFRATPLNDGDGSWELSWQADAEAVTLNGQPMEAADQSTVRPSVRSEYVLNAANPPYETSQTLVLGPVTGFSIRPAGLLTVGQGERLQLEVTVNAPESQVDPSQEVTFQSSDEAVLQVDYDGWIIGASPGNARVIITSRQTNNITAQVDVNVQGPGLYDFAAVNAPEALEAGEPLTLSWRAVALTSLSLTQVSSEDPEPESIHPPDQNGISVTVPVDEGVLNYELSWTDVNGHSGTTRLWQVDRPVLGWVCSMNHQVVTFEDPVLASAVRSLYDLNSTEDIHCSDVQQSLPSAVNGDIQEINNALLLNRCESELPIVESLEGLQHLTELVRLELECNNISDIRRLASMTSLEEINFDNNDIDDVRPLAGLDNVRVLGLYRNDLVDITGLEGLPALEILYLSENRVKDLGPLAGLTNLRHIWVYLNCDIVERNDDPDDDYVTAWSGCLSDLTPLTNLSAAVSLVFHQNEVEDISFITDSMADLALITATGNLITDASALSELPSLTTVAIDDNFLTDLTAFTANEAFPHAGVYEWSRGTVSMPPGLPFEGHLMMGYNCFDPASPQIAAQISQLEANEAQVIGAAAEFKDWCSPAAQRVTPESILRSLDSLRHSR